jgi:hypothetical protein
MVGIRCDATAQRFKQGANVVSLDAVSIHDQAYDRIGQELVQGHFAIHGTLLAIASRRIDGAIGASPIA